MAVPTGTHTATVSLGYVNSGDGQQIYYLASYYSSSCYSFYKGPARWIALSQYPGGSFVVPEAGAMFKSLDNGATWTLTGGLSPDVSSGGAFTSPAYDVGFAAFDDVGVDPNAATKITAMGNSSTGALAHYAGFFTDFNFSSESWGAGYGAVDYPTLGTHALPMPSSTPGGSVAHAVMEGSGGTPPYIIAGASVIGSSPWLIIDAAGNAHLGDDPGGRFHIGTLSEYGNVRIRSGSLMFAFPNTTSGHMEVLSRPVGSSTWAVDTVSSIDGLYRTNQPPWMSSATDLFFMGTNQRSIYLVQKAGGVWGTPVLLWAPTTDTNPDLAGATGGRIWQLIASCNPVLGGLDITFEYDGLVVAPGDVMLTFHLPPTGAGWTDLVGGCSDVVSGPAVACGSPPSGKVGIAYSHTFPATGGTPPYTFSITTGTLPPGLLLTSGSGNVSGTPTLAGDYPITVTVTDAASATGTANCSLHIDPGILLNCNTPPGGALGNPYSHSLTITGAPAGSTVAITGGALPPGLTIDDTGLISGTPTLGGTFPFTATVTPPTTRSGRSVITLPGSSLGWDFKQCPNAPIPGAIGGYEYSGAQYLFLFQGGESPAGDFNLHALKSTDLGVTWTDTGSIFVPNNAGGHGLAIYASCMDGSTIYVMGIDVDGTGSGLSNPTAGPIWLFKYNLTTNSFDAGGPLAGAPTVWKGWYGSNYPPRSSMWLHLLRRGPGDMLLLYTGIETLGANQCARVCVATFNGSSCGAGVALPGQAGVVDAFIEKCATFDASNNLHVILSGWFDQDSLHHVAMDPGGGFGTFQTVETDCWQNDTSNLLDFTATADTLAFLCVRNSSSTNNNGDLAIYSAPGGSLSPTWTFHNVLASTPNVVVDPYLAPDWLAGLGYLDGTLHAFWTQTGVPPSWSISAKQGQIHSSTAAVTDLTAWTVEATVMGPFDGSGLHWGAMQVGVWAGPAIGLGVVANFEGYDDGVGGSILESSYVLTIPPAGGGGGGGPVSVSCTVTMGYGTLTTSCGAPPVYTQNVAGAPYRPPVVMGEIGLPPVYDLNHTLVWTFPAVVPPGMHWETDPASPNYGYLVGAPTSSGVQSFTYQVFAPDGQSVTNTCPLTVNPSGGGGGGGGGGPLHIFCNNPPGGKVGVPYSHTFPVVGATGSTVYSVVVGALPPGVTLDPATGDLTGTPTAPGTYSFSVKVQQ